MRFHFPNLFNIKQHAPHLMVVCECFSPIVLLYYIRLTFPLLYCHVNPQLPHRAPAASYQIETKKEKKKSLSREILTMTRDCYDYEVASLLWSDFPLIFTTASRTHSHPPPSPHVFDAPPPLLELPRAPSSVLRASSRNKITRARRKKNLLGILSHVLALLPMLSREVCVRQMPLLSAHPRVIPICSQ